MPGGDEDQDVWQLVSRSGLGVRKAGLGSWLEILGDPTPSSGISGSEAGERIAGVVGVLCPRTAWRLPPSVTRPRVKKK